MSQTSSGLRFLVTPRCLVPLEMIDELEIFQLFIRTHCWLISRLSDSGTQSAQSLTVGKRRSGQSSPGPRGRAVQASAIFLESPPGCVAIPSNFIRASRRTWNICEYWRTFWPSSTRSWPVTSTRIEATLDDAGWASSVKTRCCTLAKGRPLWLLVT